VREVRPPFSPEATVAEFAAVLEGYGVTHVIGDAFAGAWPAEAFARHGLAYTISPKTKTEIYRDVLPAINSGRVALLDHRRLLAQLAALERRPGASGRDAIDHPGRGHDDVANAAAGAILLSARKPVVTPADFGSFEHPSPWRCGVEVTPWNA
jgi:hypothetical protein